MTRRPLGQGNESDARCRFSSDLTNARPLTPASSTFLIDLANSSSPQLRERRGFGSSALRPGLKYLDCAVGAIDPEPVAAANARRGVAAADDGRDAEFAGDNRGMG